MSRTDPVKRAKRAAIVVLGLILTQLILYWPSLFGDKVLLPVDLLDNPAAVPGKIAVHDRLLNDPIAQTEPMRRFAVSEVRAGRWPLWDPRNYCGAPFLGNNQSGVLSPFRLLDYLWPGPAVLAWGQMLRALVGGIGAYLFFRRALHAKFIAATFGAWVWPNCGFLALWTMWNLSASALWLPWLLLAVHRCVRRPRGRSIAMLSLFTGCALLSGHSAVGAHALLGSGLYALWMLARHSRGRRLAASACLIMGWLLGAMLASPQLFPTLDYMRDSLRLANRLQAGSETKPVGLAALPQVFMPWIDGSTRTGSIYLLPDLPMDSAIGGYVGLLMVLVFAPFGFGDRNRRAGQIFWLALAIVASAYILDLPGAWTMSRLPGISSLRGNRFIFVAAFSLLTLSVLGMDVLLRNRAAKSRWILIGPMISLGLAGLCVWRSTEIADLVSTQAAPTLLASKNAGDQVFNLMVNSLNDLINRLSDDCLLYAGLCVAAFTGQMILRYRPNRWLVIGLGVAALAEVLASVQPINPQCDRSLYDWHMPVLSDIAAAEPGRICGVNCLPPMLNTWFGLSDVRGYDAADPLKYFQYLQVLAAPDSPPPGSIAATYRYVPKFPSGLADFLSLRYLIYRGNPVDPAQARFVRPGYFVVENKSAMPRASVPRSAQIISDETQRLHALAEPRFDPRRTVILEDDVALPKSAIEGTAKIVGELASHIEIDYSISNDGFIVLADTWDSGWRAKVNDREAPVLRANHAFRAIPVTAGNGHITLDYKPMSFTIGLWLAAIAGISLLLLGFGKSRFLFNNRLAKAA